MSRLRFASICLVSPAILANVSAPAIAQITFRTVVLNGERAPGTPPPVTYGGGIGAAVIDNAGRVAFTSVMNGLSGYLDQTGAWTETSGSISLLARNGGPAPGTDSGVNFQTGAGFPSYVSNAEHTALMATLEGPGVTSTNDLGLWSDGGGSFQLLARSDSPAPGAGTGVWFARTDTGQTYGFGPPAINRLGQSAFRAVIAGSGVSSSNNTGIWRGRPGDLSLVVREGSAAPGTPSGATFGDLRTSGVVNINGSGRVVFGTTLLGSGITSSNNTGIWSDATGTMTLVARAGSPAPGTGVNFGSLAGASINDAGQLAFFGALAGSGVTGSNNQGIWSGAPGSLSLIARTGDSAPGTDAGVNFGSFFGTLLLNHTGKTAFLGTVTGPGVTSNNFEGVWSDAFGSLSLIARTGSPAPDTEAGVTFTGDFQSLAMNGAGQIAFVGEIVGPGVGSGFHNNQGIWATDRNGNLRLIVRANQLFEIQPGVFGTIQDLGLNISGGSGGENGQRVCFNDSGQLVFRASFNNIGGGIFVANIPEPTTITLLAMGALLAVGCRRGHPLRSSHSRQLLRVLLQSM